MTTTEPEYLSITINHSKPLELKRFTASMLCIENQYKQYLSKRGVSDEDYDLYLYELREGSIIIKFIKGPLKQLFEHYVLEQFVKHFGEKIKLIIDQKFEEDAGMTVKDLKDIRTVSEAISDDYNANLQIQSHVGDNITQNINFSGIEANAVRDECIRLISEKDSPVGEHVKQVVLHWSSASEESKTISSIDKGIIEDVNPRKKVKLVCDEDLKQEMISENENNPFNMFFIVDAEVKRVAGKPVAYVIRKIHDKGFINDDSDTDN